MNDKPLPPIPTPISLRWREFRVRALPILFFVTAFGCVCAIWQRNLTAPMLVGAVEVRSAQVAVPYAGKILQLSVDNFETVTQGQPVAVLVPSDPRVALGVIQSELDILQAKLDPHLTQQRNQTDYEQLRMDYLLQRVELATARVNYELAQSELVRTQELHDAKLVPDELYDIAQKTEEALATEILERSNLVAEAEFGIKNLELLGAPEQENDPMKPLLATLQIEEDKLATAAAASKPLTLVAPMAGAVTITRQTGENLVEGDSVLTVTATKPEKIISYLRQPMPFEPRVGMQVQVRTRALQNQTALAEIIGVGAHFENITNALAMTKLNTPYDLGLPIEINVPAGLNIRPGELVDLTVHSEN